MEKMNLYDEAHLIVSAIRVSGFQKKTNPSFSDVASLLKTNVDWVSRICTQLCDLEIVEIVTGVFESESLFIIDHTKIEDIPKDLQKVDLEEEVKKFKLKPKNEFEEKALAAVAEKNKKEQELFDRLQSGFKSEMNKF